MIARAAVVSAPGGSWTGNATGRLWLLAAGLAIAGVAAIAIDLPVARWVGDDHLPSAVQKICGLSETFGHGIGVLMVALAVAVLDPFRRSVLPRMLAASLGSGLAADVVKLMMGRSRPKYFDLDSGVLSSFGDWFPLMQNGSALQSFPSSHAATAAGLAIVLVYYYPRGRWLFVGIAICACLQRIAEGAHFTSDVLWGAAVGCVFAPLCVYGSPLARCFDALESRQFACKSSPLPVH